MKRFLSMLLCATTILPCLLTGCGKQPISPTDTADGTTDRGDESTCEESTFRETEAETEAETPPEWIEGELTEYTLSQIVYQQTARSQSVDERLVGLSVNTSAEYRTGDTVTAGVTMKRELGGERNKYYAIVDWGDGTWSYYGPFMRDMVSTVSLSHAYKTSGSYAVKGAFVTLSGGRLYGWTEGQICNVVGEDVYDEAISGLKPFASTVSAGNVADMLDGDSATFVKTQAVSDIYDEQFAGLFFDDFYRLERLEIQFPADQSKFPSNIALEYTTDGGATWYALPKYYYLYDYNIGRYEPDMDFPNPMGATLVFDMDGIVANGVRFTAKRFAEAGGTFAISEMRAYGDKELLFYTDMGGTYDADLNNMWTIFGTAYSEPGTEFYSLSSRTPFRTGMALILSTEWAEWNGLKFNWTGCTNEKAAYLNQLINMRYGPDGWSDAEGYIYATADGPTHLGLQRHYTYNSIFIIATRDYLLLGNHVTVNQNGAEIPLMEATNRHGQSMRDKLDKAMQYMLETLDGKTGILTIYDPENDGTQTGNPSNYWDVHRAYGYKSAYENALFYASLVAMAEIEAFCGNTEQAQYYTELAAKTRKAYNDLFWDEEKGRYICSENVKGERIDFGMTVVNFYAAAYGLADADKAQRIYDWIDGKRIIEGDTSRGADIYGMFVYAARTNTLDVSSTGEPYYWYDHNGALPCTPGTFGGFGNQMQNGGTIFYTAYYDMMGRLRTLGADNAYTRFSVIMEEFHKDSLRRNRFSEHGEYREGVIGEFPESGLVPLTYLNGFMGLRAGVEGLVITPALPAEYGVAGVREYHFNDRVYSIEISREIIAPAMEQNGEVYTVRIPATGGYIITRDNQLTALSE